MRTSRLFAAVVLSVLVVGGGAVSYKHLRTAPVPQTMLSTKPPTLPKDCSAFQQALASGSSLAPSHPPIENKLALDPDEIAIYTAVVEKWVSDDPASLNVANRTLPLEVTADSTALIQCSCVSGIAPETLLKASLSFHRLPPGILPKRVKLVDPERQDARVRANDPQNTLGRGKSVEDAVANGFANGLFSVSEIAFDNERKHALVRLSFVCGSLCGSGTTALFEKVGGHWKRNDRTCGGWVS